MRFLTLMEVQPHYKDSDLVYFPGSCASLRLQVRVSESHYIRDGQRVKFPMVYGQQLMFRSARGNPLDMGVIGKFIDYMEQGYKNGE
jgi:hypothetical protein